MSLVAVACAGRVDSGIDLETEYDQPVLASIERTSCYGWCPVYRLTVFIDGTIEYMGIDFVLHKGLRMAQATPEQVLQLRQAFSESNYGAFADHYTELHYTDFPTVVVTYRSGDKLKQVVHYYGDSSAPQALVELEDRIEQILEVDQFIGTRAEREAFAESW